MAREAGAREQLLQRVMAYATSEGVTGKSLREIALGAGSSHRMLLYHFGSREGLLAAIVAAIEGRQRAVLAELAEHAQEPTQVMLGLWQQVSSRSCGRSSGCSSRSSGWWSRGHPAPRACARP